MITGTGIDIANIGRIKKLLDDHGERFISKVLSPEERKHIPEARKTEFIAGRFAAKEALAKATDKKFTLTKVSVVNDSSGKPYFTGDFFAKELAGIKVHLSITHDTDYAAAFVIIESPEEIER
ncbi:MAG TPA: holo-ACP synthase [Spirochaetota bacterium]|nr:holo-ACP synthase [Spirochaetota bacterium]